MLGHRTLGPAEYLGILKRRRWIFLVTLLVCPLLAAAAIFFIPARYQSQALVIIDQPKVSADYVKSVIAVGLENRLSSMKEQILSRSRIQPIVDRYNLYASTRMSMDEKVDETRKAIVIKVIPSALSRAGGLPGFFILFSAADARTAQQVCAEITGLFINENLSSRQSTAEGTTDFLKSQLADAQRSLDEHDAKLAAFQRQYIGRLPSETSTNSGLLSSLTTQLAAATEAVDRAEQDKVYQESILAQMSGTSEVGPAPTEQTAPNPQRVAKEQELLALENQQADLVTHYTSDYPDVVRGQRKISELRKQIVQMPAFVRIGSTGSPLVRTDTDGIRQVKARLLSAQTNVIAKRKIQQDLQGQARQYQTRLESSPQVEQEYKELDRGYQESKKFYDDIAARMNSAKMSTDLERRQEGEQFRVMDPANLPDSPIFPSTPIFMGGGVLAGLALGALIAAFLEYRDTSLRTERDVWAFTQLPTLAVIGFIDESMQDVPGKRFLFFKRKPAKEAVASAG